MSEFKHTPGPWSVSWSLVGKWLVYIGKHIHALDQERESDARLIAAAPAMYEYIASSASNGCVEATKIMEAIHACR